MAIVNREVKGLTGLVIILVLLYNLWPTMFPNCFTAVDLLFIICGYQSKAAMSSHSISVGQVAAFYFERAKKLFPVYYLMVPLILMNANMTIGIAWIDATGKMGLYSLALLKNMETLLDEEDDITSAQSDIQDKDAFRHLWAVAVEFHFYIVAPLVFFLLEKLRKRSLQIFCLCVMCSISFGLFYTGDRKMAFNLLPMRLWQFGLGILAFTIASKRRIQTIGSITYVSNPVYFLSTSLITFAFLSIAVMVGVQEIAEIVMRPLASLSCFILLVMQTPTTKKFLSNKIFTYLGGISYTLYIISWPIVLLFGSKLSPQMVIGSTVILSIACHKYYEKKCRKFSLGKTVFLFGSLAVLNIWVFLTFLRCPVVRAVIKDSYYEKVSENLRGPLKDNLKLARDRVMQPHGLRTQLHPSIQGAGVYDFAKGYGKLKVAVLGDALGMNEVNLINEEFKGSYSEFKAVLGPDLTGLYENFDGSEFDRKILYETAVDLIEGYKPDVLFLVFKVPHEQNVEKLKSLSHIVKENIERLEKSCRKILLHGLFPYLPRGELSKFIDTLSLGKDLGIFSLNKTIVKEQNNNRQVLLDAVDCERCQLYDIGKAFIEGKNYQIYDTLTTVFYFDDFGYLTYAGLDKIRSVYFDIISGLLL